MSATVTSMSAGFSAIAVRSAAMLKEPWRKLPQMPRTETRPVSLIAYPPNGCRGERLSFLSVAGKAAAIGCPPRAATQQKLGKLPAGRYPARIEPGERE